MVETDRRQHCRDRMLDQIRRIQPSAKSGLQYEILDLLPLKNQKPRCKEQFKISWMRIAIRYHRIDSPFHLLKSPGEAFL